MLKNVIAIAAVISLCILSGCSSQGNSSDQINEPVIEVSESKVLKDGITVDCWKYPNASIFTLPNGIELLQVNHPWGPNDVMQSNIVKYYEEKGVEYDVEQELEKAYDAYLQQSDRTSFDSYLLSQEIYQTASSERILYFITSVMIPINGKEGYEHRIGTAFERETGTVINIMDLFLCDEEEVVQMILQCANIQEQSLKEEITNAFDPANVVFFPEHIEISFEPGSIPSEEHSYIIAINYEEGIADLLYDWAIPQAVE